MQDLLSTSIIIYTLLRGANSNHDHIASKARKIRGKEISKGCGRKRLQTFFQVGPLLSRDEKKTPNISDTVTKLGSSENEVRMPPSLSTLFSKF